MIIGTPLLLTFRWWQGNEEKGIFPVGIWGISLVLLSTFYIPWLNLNPLQHLGLDWLPDVIPPGLEIVRKLLHTDRFGSLINLFGILEPIFGPPGWVTLLVAAQLPTAIIGTITVAVGFVVVWHPNWKPAGIAVLFLSSLTFLILFCNLPTIDGLGERSFPSLTSLAIPLVGAHIEWGGPLVMMAGLCLLFFAGAQSYASAEPVNEESRYGE